MTSHDHAAWMRQLVEHAPPEQRQEILDKLSAPSRLGTFLAGLDQRKDPEVRRRPRRVRGYQIRLDLRDATPPVWRRLVLPGDLTLDCVGGVIEAAMGWTGFHLHRFRTGVGYGSPSFVTDFDLDEGEDEGGVLEDDVRLDQVVAAAGDRLWYEYDFGDGWDHVLKVEEVLPDPPADVELVTGKRACPPEDCGGIGGYADLVAWVDSGYADHLLPRQFSDATEARDWLPPDWRPDRFDLEAAQGEVGMALEPLEGQRD